MFSSGFDGGADIRFDISEELKKLPQKPGVYIMKDARDAVIYVGKAINLKNRVRQYFQPSSAENNPKVIEMVPNIAEFEYIVTESEVDALILECNLIKKYMPKYNILLKDDKAYPYIKLTMGEEYPRVFMTRKHERDKARYYGPYTSVYAVSEVLEVINGIWPLRKCLLKFPRDKFKNRPCLNYHIGRCKAPCNDLISKEDYAKMAEDIAQFLGGKYKQLAERLEARMREYSESLEFEKAAELRDKIAAINRLGEKQVMEDADEADRDIIAFARAGDEALVQVFFVRGGKVSGREHFMLDGAADKPREEVMAEFVKQFYGETTFIPKELVLECDILDKHLIVQWLSGLKGRRVTVTVPQKGDKMRLVRMAAENAIITLEQFGERIKREQSRTTGALAELQAALLEQGGLDVGISRIEAYDISNIQGYESVGSMVVFENGAPKRSDYRKFKVKSVAGANDAASMEEVITRRFMRYREETDGADGAASAAGKFSTLPDILFIDGGAVQVGAAEQALRAAGVDIPVCGMVKDDRHRTRGLLYGGREIALKHMSEGFKLLTRVQDEVHRFAVEYHRKLREKAQVRSVLDDIPGIGALRRKALMKRFGSIEAIKAADIEALAGTPGMDKRAAAAVHGYFRNPKAMGQGGGSSENNI